MTQIVSRPKKVNGSASSKKKKAVIPNGDDHKKTNGEASVPSGDDDSNNAPVTRYVTVHCNLKITFVVEKP